jgi:hypothetical protein
LKYYYKYRAVDSNGLIHIESNSEITILDVAEQFNYEVRKKLPQIIIGTGRNKKILKDRYSVIRKINNSTQLSFL